MHTSAAIASALPQDTGQRIPICTMYGIKYVQIDTEQTQQPTTPDHNIEISKRCPYCLSGLGLALIPTPPQFVPPAKFSVRLDNNQIGFITKLIATRPFSTGPPSIFYPL